MEQVPYGFEHRSLQASWRNAQQYAPVFFLLVLLLLLLSIFYPDPSSRSVLESYYRIIYSVFLVHLGALWVVSRRINKTGKVSLILLRIFVGFVLVITTMLSILDNMGRQDLSAICVTLFLLPVIIHVNPKMFMALILPYTLVVSLAYLFWQNEPGTYLAVLIQVVVYTVISLMVQKNLFSNRLDRYLCQLEILEANARISKLASRDLITGLYNQKHFESLLSAEWQRSRRHSHVFTLIEMDLDFPVGDELLRNIGAYLQTLLRRSDHAARLGDARFLLLLVETEQEGARILAERLRIGLAQLPSAKELGHSITSSIALATSSEAPSVEDLQRLIQNRLMRAKNSGPGHIVAK